MKIKIFMAILNETISNRKVTFILLMGTFMWTASLHLTKNRWNSLEVGRANDFVIGIKESKTDSSILNKGTNIDCHELIKKTVYYVTWKGFYHTTVNLIFFYTIWSIFIMICLIDEFFCQYYIDFQTNLNYGIL